MAAEPSPDAQLLARMAGLSAALSDFPGDVAAAAASAAAATRALKLPEDPVAEPWPPMQVSLPA